MVEVWANWGDIFLIFLVNIKSLRAMTVINLVKLLESMYSKTECINDDHLAIALSWHGKQYSVHSRLLEVVTEESQWGSGDQTIGPNNEQKSDIMARPPVQLSAVERTAAKARQNGRVQTVC